MPQMKTVYDYVGDAALVIKPGTPMRVAAIDAREIIARGEKGRYGYERPSERKAKTVSPKDDAAARARRRKADAESTAEAAMADENDENVGVEVAAAMDDFGAESAASG